MDKKGLTEKEAALLAAARREVAARGAAPAQQPAAGVRPAARPAPRPTPQAASADAAPPRPAAAPAHLSPEPFPDTVIGWDHPAARKAPKSGLEEKWARIAAVMELERQQAQAKREKLRRVGIGVLVVAGFCLFVLAAAGTLPLLRG